MSMSKTQRESKKEFAKSLFLKNIYTQEELSNIIGVSRRTLGNWIKCGNWEKLRSSCTITPDSLITQLSKQLNDINSNIASREEGNRFATAKEADAMLKIATTIKKLQKEIGITEIVAVFMQFAGWLHMRGEKDTAKDILRLMDCYIKEKSERGKI